MQIQPQIPLLETILAEYQELIGPDFTGYRNHAYRMIHFCWKLQDCTQEQQQKIIIAAAFHDIGIWIDDTLDYIPPSVPPAMQYLKAQKLESWSEEISLMITEHHKLKPYTGKHETLVELFRQGDLVDFSLAMVRFGIDKTYIRAVKSAFPNAGFHKMLLKRSSKWFIRHPLNPAPMMKW